MVCRRALVLDFVRGYIGRWGISPSLGEIAAALGTNRTRVQAAIRALAADGLLLRGKGPRALALPDQRSAALSILRQLGWAVDEPAGSVTHSSPAVPPVLDYKGR
ncbi:MAG TPA: hypothetical protein VFF98_17240 [Novosphingobium sp.]|nr:hypothetical protein [Novosphingobium sp.]